MAHALIADRVGTPQGTRRAAVLLEDVTRFRLLDQVKSDLVATASHELNFVVAFSE